LPENRPKGATLSDVRVRAGGRYVGTSFANEIVDGSPDRRSERSRRPRLRDREVNHTRRLPAPQDADKSEAAVNFAPADHAYGMDF